MGPCCNKDARAGVIDTSRRRILRVESSATHLARIPRRATSRVRAAQRLPDMDTKTAADLLVQAIDYPDRLVNIYATETRRRRSRQPDRVICPASGEGKPLPHCSLRFAEPGEGDHPDLVRAVRSPVGMDQEVGPVYVRASRCGGYSRTSESPLNSLPAPRILRTYRGDDTITTSTTP